MDIKQDVYKLVASTFNLSVNEIKNEFTSNDVEKWDSLGQFKLIQAIETKFGFTFEVEDIFKIIDIQSIIDIVKEKVN